MTSRHLIAAVLLGHLLIGCGDNGGSYTNQNVNANQQTNSNHNSDCVPVGTWSYAPESATLDASAWIVEIVGLFAEHVMVESCTNIPTAEVRHRIVLTRGGHCGISGKLVQVTPISMEEFEARRAPTPPDHLWETDVGSGVVVRARFADHFTLCQGWVVGVGSGEWSIYPTITLPTDGGDLDFEYDRPLGSCGGACGDGVCDDWETPDGCPSDCGGCGNGVLEEGEQCDVGDFGGLTCEDFGRSGEGLQCMFGTFMPCMICEGNCGPALP